LDPLASGLLIVCTGKFTKQINNIMVAEKEYTGNFTLGAVTPTYDLESTPENQQSVDHITLEQIREAARSFIGNIMQYPPVYSAIKKAGTPLYELARRGEAVDLKARPVSISSFEIRGWNSPVAEFKVSCSTGTYIRSLAHDLGRELGCGAYLSALRRTRIGDFKVQDAQTMKEFIGSLAHGS
ncbi:MAG: tRNA pseudouridine(55) synthase TruB, partial [Chitinophagaceae bacterium]